MKKYIKPSTTIIVIDNCEKVMMNNPEVEISGNIGAKENNMMFDWDDGEFADLWEEEEKENKELW